MLNQESIDLIKEFEGLELEAYLDAVGVLTIGYGHTNMAGSPKVVKGMKITKQEAENILRSDLKKYEKYVQDAVKVDLNENQYGALVSFVYNVGNGNFTKSTLLKKVNAKDWNGAAAEFAKWNKAGGKVLKGLTRRRTAERFLFEKPVILPSKPVQTLPDDPGVQVPEKPEASPRASIGEIITMIITLIFGDRK